MNLIKSKTKLQLIWISTNQLIRLSIYKWQSEISIQIIAISIKPAHGMEWQSKQLDPKQYQTTKLSTEWNKQRRGKLSQITKQLTMDKQCPSHGAAAVGKSVHCTSHHTTSLTYSHRTTPAAYTFPQEHQEHKHSSRQDPPKIKANQPISHGDLVEIRKQIKAKRRRRPTGRAGAGQRGGEGHKIKSRCSRSSAISATPAASQESAQEPQGEHKKIISHTKETTNSSKISG